MRALRGLDLFCGAGGASAGYAQAGFDMLGVDIKPMPRYPFDFIQCDALNYLDYLLGAYDGAPCYAPAAFDFIHASPPCQRFSKMSNCRPGIAAQYPDLIGPVRERLDALGLPYVIENVPQAPLRRPVRLCGSQFDLTAWWPDHGAVGLRRHRDFETNWPLASPGPCDHKYLSARVYGGGFDIARLRVLPVVGVYGHGDGRMKVSGKGWSKITREVMQIDWMNRDELNEALPPAMTRHVGLVLADWLALSEGRFAA